MKQQVEEVYFCSLSPVDQVSILCPHFICLCFPLSCLFVWRLVFQDKDTLSQCLFSSWSNVTTISSVYLRYSKDFKHWSWWRELECTSVRIYFCFFYKLPISLWTGHWAALCLHFPIYDIETGPLSYNSAVKPTEERDFCWS